MLQSKPNVASMYDLSSLGGSSNGTSGMNLFNHRIDYSAIVCHFTDEFSPNVVFNGAFIFVGPK